MDHAAAAPRNRRDRAGGVPALRAGGELDDCRRLAIRYGLFGFGVFALIAFLFRRFRRLGATHPVWIECDELQRRLTAGDQVLLLDVRQPDELTSPPGHLPGAVNVPLAELADRTPDLARRKQPIVVVCKTDRSSARAATELLAAVSRMSRSSAAAQTVGINAGWRWNDRQHPAILLGGRD